MTIDLQIASFKTVLHIHETTAPEAYDGFGTFTIAESRAHKGESRTTRLVAIRQEHVEWQRGRYGSGFHASQPLGEHGSTNFYLDVDDLIELFLARLMRKEEA